MAKWLIFFALAAGLSILLLITKFGSSDSRLAGRETADLSHLGGDSIANLPIYIDGERAEETCPLDVTGFEDNAITQEALSSAIMCQRTAGMEGLSEENQEQMSQSLRLFLMREGGTPGQAKTAAESIMAFVQTEFE